MNVNEREYMEFLGWKAQREAEQAERERLARTRQLQRQQHEDFERRRRIDADMNTYIQKGATWNDYLRATAAPGDLRERYLELQKQSGVVPGSKKESEFDSNFLKGFQMGVG